MFEVKIQVGRVKFLTYKNVSICNNYHVSDIFEIGGENIPGGLETHWMG